MERQDFHVPLLIGGATTSRVHTAVKIAPNYREPTIWVKDASRAVGVVQKLISSELKDDYVAKIRADYEETRTRHAGKQAAVRWLSLADARENKAAIDWRGYQPPKPATLGITAFADYPLDELTRTIDWTPFFITWELHGRYPAILKDKKVGTEATKLFNDAQAMLKRLIADKSLTAKGVIGLFPANSVGDEDVDIYKDESRRQVLTTLHFLRQQDEKPPGRPNRSLADFIAPKETGVADYIGAFAVTTGIGVEQLANHYKQNHDDYNAIMVQALADRLAEAFAERLHERVRKEFWGYAKDEALSSEQMIKEKYQGIRPAPGYPACPDHTEKALLFDLIDATRRADIKLTESYAMWPAAAVSGFYFSHPESQYFAVGKLNRDQVEDYALRKGMEVATLERWLAPNLGYEPEG